ncbi:alanine racemase [Pleomorphomonas sp. PLEO]|uniref:alanine racemase n=1 Tax=Pleomorphomonas sp. PLEO TaxID=3239306 RepID=UPI00351ECB8E
MRLSSNIEKVIRDIAASGSSGRSFYVYELTPMVSKIAGLRSALPERVEIFYAMKANPHPAFLRAALDAGIGGVEIASIGEGKKAIEAGFSPKQIVFTGPGKSPEELRWAATTGIRLVHIESLTEAHRLNSICSELGTTQNILIRVNPNFQVHGAQATFSGDSSKFGIDQNQFLDKLHLIIALSNLSVQGLHVYSASGVLVASDLLENCRRVFELASVVSERHHVDLCKVIDFGGGFGIDYLETGADFSLPEYASGLKALIARYGYEDRQFVLELGRYLAADSGWYCSEILDIKSSLGVKQVVCQGGSHHFRRPVALKINHPTSIVSIGRPPVFEEQEEVVDEEAFIGGALCNSADKLTAEPIVIQHARIGDIFVVGLAGAYGYSMSHLDFLSHERPEEVVVP